MTLDGLVQWIDRAMERLPEGRSYRERRRHIRKLYRILDPRGPDWEFRADWHALAGKIADLTREAVPESPDMPAEQRLERTPWRPPEGDKEWEAIGSEIESGMPKKREPRRKGARSSRRQIAEKPKRPSIEMNAQLQGAFDAVAAGRPIIFVTGGAGTGKSTFIRELRERFPDKKSVVLAPTGVAALNAGGQTIHSFCRLPLRPVMPDDRFEAEDPKLVQALDLVIIDEVSMVRADTLDGVDAFLRMNRKSPLPFGGVQIVLVGDLFQLPPVVTSRDEAVISERYESPHFFSAHCLRGLRFKPIELEIVYRQRDASFARLLAKIRDGVDVDDAIRELNERCVGRALSGQYLILVPTRRAAAEENETRLAALSGAPRLYASARTGTFVQAGDDRLPAPAELVLKPGAQVMFVRNDAQGRWVNGTVGIVEKLEASRIRVRTGSETWDVEPVEWQDVRYAFDSKTRTVLDEVAGEFKQFPLMLAWAVTIHKAQGLTLERVLVDLERGAFAEGQVYVALSRCQTIEGLSLRRPVRRREVQTSEAAREFYAKITRRARGA